MTLSPLAPVHCRSCATTDDGVAVAAKGVARAAEEDLLPADAGAALYAAPQPCECVPHSRRARGPRQVGVSSVDLVVGDPEESGDGKQRALLPCHGGPERRGVCITRCVALRRAG
eukprot:1875711-Prymnesium_polylepis.1